MRIIALACLAAAVLCCLLIDSPVGHGQTPQEPPRDSINQGRQDQPDVLRVYTEIVQTDVMVFEKQGRFVDGLKRGDFELKIDGAPKPLEFFEKITVDSFGS